MANLLPSALEWSDATGGKKCCLTWKSRLTVLLLYNEQKLLFKDIAASFTDTVNCTISVGKYDRSMLNNQTCLYKSGQCDILSQRRILPFHDDVVHRRRQNNPGAKRRLRASRVLPPRRLVRPLSLGMRSKQIWSSDEYALESIRKVQ